MQVAFFDAPQHHVNLLPLTYTRPLAELRLGALTIREKWELVVGRSIGHYTARHLHGSFPEPGEVPDLVVAGNVLPSDDLVDAIRGLQSGEALCKGDRFLAGRPGGKEFLVEDLKSVNYPDKVDVIDRPWDIFALNGQEIRRDVATFRESRKSQKVQNSATAVYGEDIFVEEGVLIKASVLNSEEGPIYLGKSAIVEEGAIIRGPLALGEGAKINMGAKIRSNTSIGPFCKVGGEVSNAIMHSYSNKSHDGYLGNSVIGSWCNIGADTNTSNMKNNYTNVKMWSYGEQEFVDTGLQFCGLIMGDHSKCGINTMFNTGTVVGVSSSIFGGGFPSKFIPSFSWGGLEGTQTYRLEKALETAEISMRRRNQVLTEEEREMLRHIFEATGPLRNWED